MFCALLGWEFVESAGHQQRQTTEDGNNYMSYINPLDSKGSYSATSNNTKLVHWPLMGGLLLLVQRGGPGQAVAPASSLLAVPNVTALPSTANVPITVLLYDGPLLCGFNVMIKGLTLAELH